MKPFKPLLAETCVSIANLRYPVLVSPKLDGIRCVKLGGKALTRKLKPIVNPYVRAWVETNLPDGIDGELMLRDHRTPFSEVSSAIMGKPGEPDFVFCAFDLVDDPDVAFEQRYAALKRWVGPGAHHLALVPHVLVNSAAEMQEVVDAHVDMGYEGSMVRSLKGRYKFGRSTLKEAILLKVKAWQDEEGVVVGMIEGEHNENEATKDALGRTKRSTAQAGKIAAGTLGALIVRMDEGMLAKVSPGKMKHDERQRVWDTAVEIGGSLPGFPEAVLVDPAQFLPAKFKHQPPPGGRKAGEAPRFPVFLGWRQD